jgi:mono/diheme cytochrome c family protein
VNTTLTLRTTALATTAVLLAIVAGGCSSPASTNADGKALVSELCGQCHPLERVKAAKKDQSGWTATVGRMRTHGLTVTEEQAASIIAYLTKRDAGQ